MAARRVQLHEVLGRLSPGASWWASDEQYDAIVWEDDSIPMPSPERFEQVRLQMQEELDASEYRRERAAAYPSLAEQLDMLFWDMKEGTSRWLDAVEDVKRRFPKGAEASGSEADAAAAGAGDGGGGPAELEGPR